jgi:hypothetical protein
MYTVGSYLAARLSQIGLKLTSQLQVTLTWSCLMNY